MPNTPKIPHVGNALTSEILKQLDANHDGKITYDEVIKKSADSAAQDAIKLFCKKK